MRKSRISIQVTKGVSKRSVWFWATLIFVAGFSLRLLLILETQPHFHRVPTAEINHIAHSLAYNGTYSDAYAPGSGPTAHDVPIYPLLLALLIRVFGEGTAGEFAIYALTCAGASLAYAFLPLLSELCLFGRLPGVLAGFVGALLPLNLWMFVAGTNQPISAFFMVVLAMLFCKTADSGFSPAWNIRTGIVAGTLCLFNSAFLTVLLVSAAAGLFLRRPFDWRMVRSFLTILFCALVAVTPWAVRNQRVLGSAIFTRSNLGTELDLSNRSGASPVMDRLVRSASWNHPLYDAHERAKLRIMGEPAYNAARLRTALQWMRSEPAEFLRLSGERILLFWFPLRSAFLSTLSGCLESLAGLCGLVLVLVRRRARAWVFAGLLLGYFPVFALLVTDPRYSYPVDPLLLLLAGFFVTSSFPGSFTEIRARSAAGTQQNCAVEVFPLEEVGSSR